MIANAHISSEGPIARRSLHEELVDRLRALIVEGHLAPGVKIPERDLCESLGVSRTPLREALKVLASEGLVALTPNRGASVSQLTSAEVGEIFPIIGALEGLAGALACQRITQSELAKIEALQQEMTAFHAAANLPGYFRCNQEIHQKILAASGNSALMATHASLSARIARYRYMANLSDVRWRQALDEHERILRALKARDGGALSLLLQSHFEEKMRSVLATTDEASARSSPDGEKAPGGPGTAFISRAPEQPRSTKPS